MSSLASPPLHPSVADPARCLRRLAALLPASRVLSGPAQLAAYESDLGVRAYVVPVAVGDALTAMPLFLEPGQAVEVPLEGTYCAAFAAVPRRWQRVLELPNA